MPDDDFCMGNAYPTSPETERQMDARLPVHASSMRVIYLPETGRCVLRFARRYTGGPEGVSSVDFEVSKKAALEVAMQIIACVRMMPGVNS